jgi:two-component system C4-dicarboxylate transport response regulator DctD
MQQHDWPGNVRELAHFAERAALGVHQLLKRDDVTQLFEDCDGSLSQEMERQEERLIRGALLANRRDIAPTIASPQY